MEIALACLVVVTLFSGAVIAALLLALRAERQGVTALIVTHASERAALIEQATDERRELLNRVMHPEILIAKTESVPAPEVAPEEDDEWSLIGVVQSTVESDGDPEPDPAEAAPQ